MSKPGSSLSITSSQCSNTDKKRVTSPETSNVVALSSKVEGENQIESYQKDSNTYISLSESSQNVVQALEQELDEQRKHIVTSFQLRELSSASGFLKPNSVKYGNEDDVLKTKAEEHFENGMDKENNEIKCISCFSKAISLQPMESKYYVKRGECYLALCDFQSGILNYKKACILSPDNDEYYSRLALIYYMQGQCLFDTKLYAEALESFSRAAEMKPDNTGYHIRSIVCLAALKRHSECLTLVNKRLLVERNNADLLVVRARIHQIFRNDSLCYFDLKDALRINCDNEQAKIMLKHLTEKAETFKDQALKLQLIGKVNEALMKLSNAIEADPGNAEYHIYRGALHRQTSDYNSAIDDYLVAMDKLNHDSMDKIYKEAERQLLLCYNDFAVECFSNGFYEEAIVLLNKAIKDEKNEKGLYINRGDCFLRMLEFDFSLSDYNQALEMDPKDSTIKIRISFVYNELGLLSYSDKKYIQAYEYFNLAVESNPKIAAYYTARAKTRYMLKDVEGAKLDVASSLILEPQNRTVLSLFARLFPDQTIQSVLHSPTGMLSSQLIDKAISNAFPTPWRFNKDRKGSKDLSSKNVLPPILEKNIKLCLQEKDFESNKLEKKKLSKKIQKSIYERESLDYTGPRVLNTSSLESCKKATSKKYNSKQNRKSLEKPMKERTKMKEGQKTITFKA